MQKPQLPFLFQAQSALRAIPPLAKSGILSMKPTQVPAFINTLRRWKFSAAGMLACSAKRYPDRLALVDDEGELTYKELFEQTKLLAAALKTRGMTADTSFGVVARNGRGIILPMAVKAILGSEIMLMNVGSSETQIDALLKQNNASFLFIDDEFLARAPQRDDLTIVVTSITTPETRANAPEGTLFMEDLIQDGVTAPQDFETTPKQGRIIIMSSGTMGLPKGVLRDEPKTPTSMGSVADRVPWRKNMVVHQSASMFHAWGWGNVIAALGTGSTLLTMRIFDAEKAVKQCEKYGANGMISAAFFLRQIEDYLQEHPDTHIGPFKFVVSSGNAIPAWLVSALTQRFGPVIGNFYGSTEAGICSIATGTDLAKRPATAGKPAIGAKVRILDEDGNELPRGQVGLIHTAHELSFTGYMNPQNKFETKEGLLRIGDLGYMDEEGYIYVSGRADDMVIKGGENIFPRELEEHLGYIDGVGDVFCYGTNDDDAIVATLILCIVRDPNSPEKHKITVSWLRDHIRTHLADHSVPDEVYFVDELPRNANGKIVPREVKELVADKNPE